MDRRPSGPSAAGRWCTISIVAAVLVLGVTACADDDDTKTATATVPTAPPGTLTTAATSTTTIDDVEADVEAAYLEAENAYYKAATKPDPDSPLLTDHREGGNLAAVRQVMERLEADDVFVRFSSQGPPVVVVLSAEVNARLDRAEVRSCIVDDTLQVRRRTGEVLNDSSSSVMLLAELRLRKGRWLIAKATRLDRVLGGDCS